MLASLANTLDGAPTLKLFACAPFAKGSLMQKAREISMQILSICNERSCYGSICMVIPCKQLFFLTFCKGSLWKRTYLVNLNSSSDSTLILFVLMISCGILSMACSRGSHVIFQKVSGTEAHVFNEDYLFSIFFFFFLQLYTIFQIIQSKMLCVP